MDPMEEMLNNYISITEFCKSEYEQAEAERVNLEKVSSFRLSFPS